MKSLLKMTWMEAKLFLREPASAFFTLVFPLMYLFLFGMISGNKTAPEFNGQRMVDGSIPGLIAMVIATSGLMVVTITMASYREKGILRRLRTTPLHPLTVLGAQVLVTFGMTLLGMLLLIGFGKLIFHIQFEGGLLSLLGGFTLGSLSFFAIGFLLAGTMPNARTANIIGLVILYPMVFLCGAFFPLSILPEIIQKIARFLPLTYVVNLLGGLWVGDSWGMHITDIIVLAAVLAAGVLISARTFRWE